ncbi:hypothetical protein PHO31112_03306 [Pandoraea horticolens]|uniref:Uncharacterized protein n=1 Tax=Pandoraea horticolens TaxID=2508298 RepID=A0A5E4WIW8_9BURK|nr:hypothetical protein [Pandoraea horticolens]VVE24598.1 hypothetical protein PHO31112_03306 [Pandoraea horticolens]
MTQQDATPVPPHGSANAPAPHPATSGAVETAVHYPEPVCADAPGKFLDPDEVPGSGSDFKVEVYPDMAQGDHIFFYFDDGGPGQYTDEFDVSKRRVGTDTIFTVPKANIVKALNTDVVAYYIVEPAAGGDPIESHKLGLTIGAPLLLKEPSVEGVVNQHLDTDLAHKNVRVVIPIYDGMAVKDTVYLYWGAEGEPGYYDDEITLRAVRSITFVVPAEYVELYIGQTVNVRYEREQGGTLQPSHIYSLSIGDAVDVSKPAAPVIKEAIDGILNPNLALSGATGLIGPDDSLKPGVQGKTIWGGGPPKGIEVPFALPANYDVTQPYPIQIPYASIEAFVNADVTFEYAIQQAGGKWLSSNVLTLKVERQAAVVAAPSVPDAIAGVLDPRDLSAVKGCPVFVPPNADMRQGDIVNLTWACAKPAGSWTVNRVLQATDVGQAIEFDVPYDKITAGLDAKVTASYDFVRGSNAYVTSLPLDLIIVQGLLPAATIDQAKGSQLNVDDCPKGATVRLGASAKFRSGDRITLYWDGAAGAGTTVISTTVDDQEAGGDITLTVPLATVQADVNHVVTLDYTVMRASGAPEETSPPSLYDVVALPDHGPLLVMGARNTGNGCRGERQSHRLRAFNKTTQQPLNAQWRYADDDANAWTLAPSFKDTRPWASLLVQTQDDSATIHPVNIAATGNDAAPPGTSAALAARLDKGSVLAWGVPTWGGSVPSAIGAYDDVVEMASTQGAFAVRRGNGQIAAWGSSAYGGLAPAGVTDAARIVGNSWAFAVLHASGHVTAWGDAGNGGQLTPAVKALNDVVDIYHTSFSFAALRKTGGVATWGFYLTDVPRGIDTLTDIVDVRGTWSAFCALRANNKVVAWGDPNGGGSLPASIAGRSDIVELAAASGHAFAVRTAGRRVLAWGADGYGGTVPPAIANLADIEEVVATRTSFAARRGNGQVVAWGYTWTGGDVPPDIAKLTDVVQITGTDGAFAALRRDGTVVTWGNTAFGADSSTVKAQLQNVRAIYANSEVFVAVLAGGGVVTWGSAACGGDSGSVRSRLASGLSYEAVPAVSGRASSARQVW